MNRHSKGLGLSNEKENAATQIRQSLGNSIANVSWPKECNTWEKDSQIVTQLSFDQILK